MALTVGGLCWAGILVYEAVIAAITREERVRPPNETVVTVRTAEVTEGQETPSLETFGEIRSRRTLELRANAAGDVVELSPSFEDGGQVRAGDLLLRVNPAEARADLALEEANLAEAEANLRDAERAVELGHEDLAAAEEQADLRASALTRQQDLLARGVGSSAAVEEAALSASSARQAVVSRRQALAADQTRVDQASAGLNRSRVALDEARRRLSDTEIYAAFDGTLSDVSVVEGGLVSQNEKMAALIDPDALEAVFRLSTAQYARLLSDDGTLAAADVAVVMNVAGFALQTTGVIERVAGVVGEGQAGRIIYARLDHAAGFRPGDLVTVLISEPPLEQVARLPALSVDAGGMVLVLDDGDRLSEAQVEVLRRERDSVLVRAPDLAGRQIVAERTPLLGAGIRVRPLEPAGEEIEPEADAVIALVALTPERRARLIAFVSAQADMPEAERARVVAQLSQPEVPAEIVAVIEMRMGS
ncbi:MAG: HlyD family efflux transporter periplasmic adaptor subunit [Pseudomonadota bacterium]